MSAFICQPEHFGILAACAITPDYEGYTTVLPEWVVPGEPVLTAQRVARELAVQIIWVAGGHAADVFGGERPGPTGLKDAQAMEAAALWAEHYVVASDAAKLDQATRLKLCNCLAYQSNETEDWEQTAACKQLHRIRGTAVETVPGYDQAPWGWEDHTTPHIDMLIYGLLV